MLEDINIVYTGVRLRAGRVSIRRVLLACLCGLRVDSGDHGSCDGRGAVRAGEFGSGLTIVLLHEGICAVDNELAGSASGL